LPFWPPPSKAPAMPDYGDDATTSGGEPQP